MSIFIDIVELEKRIERYFQKNNVSLSWLGQQCGLSHQTLASWLKGKRRLSAVSARSIDAFLSREGF